MKLELEGRTELACGALVALDAAGSERLPGRSLAERLDITPEYLTKIISPLAREGWITSTTGPNGGYRLAIELNTLCVLDLIEAVEGRIDREKCMHGDSRNPALERCSLHEPWVRAREALLHELEETPLVLSGPSSPSKGE
jgi:Rrf2 family protein